MAIVDNAVYVDGKRTANPESLEITFEVMRKCRGVAWVGLYRPGIDEIMSMADEFDIHRLAVEDAIAAHQRPKLERYGEQLFVVLRPARYLDKNEKVELGEVHLFVGVDFVVTVRHAESPELADVRQRLESSPDLLRLGPEAILYTILDQVVDEYLPVVEELEIDTDEIEDQLFSFDPAVSRRIYTLAHEVAELQRATAPLVPMIESLRRGSDKYDVDIELQRNLRRVLDHCVRVDERVDAVRSNLQNALLVNATLVAQQQNDEIRSMTQVSLEQNEQVKKISSWGAILFAPSLIAAIYGMNFDAMPELSWQFGYQLALVAMAISSILLYIVFRRQNWL
ncbi:transporter [Rhodococcus sp. WWJCD1]|uniref:magnesium and cobalt transport protein CorA n=1 Tax=Rhodococcus sp. WWJCD1 TaxID=2022519 RepID=UPI000B9BAF6F|nr:magnesium and cobalt transport protein CorA [Rhodococcus sp. WWJCD1]OZC52451.1 transporter [Rhodococcus sp. WWJCD1]